MHFTTVTLGNFLFHEIFLTQRKSRYFCHGKFFHGKFKIFDTIRICLVTTYVFSDYRLGTIISIFMLPTTGPPPYFKNEFWLTNQMSLFSIYKALMMQFWVKFIVYTFRKFYPTFVNPNLNSGQCHTTVDNSHVMNDIIVSRLKTDQFCARNYFQLWMKLNLS